MKKLGLLKALASIGGLAVIGTGTAFSVASCGNNQTEETYHIESDKSSIGSNEVATLKLYKGYKIDTTDNPIYVINGTAKDKVEIFDKNKVKFKVGESVNNKTTITINTTISKNNISKNIDLWPDDVVTHDYHTTTTSPYLQLSSVSSVTLTTMDGTNEVNPTYQFAATPAYDILTLSGDQITINSNASVQFSIVVNAVISEVTVDTISITIWPNALPPTKYITTDTSGLLQIGNTSDYISVTITPHDVEPIDLSLTSDRTSDLDIVRTSLTNTWTIKLKSMTTLAPGNTITFTARGGTDVQNIVFTTVVLSSISLTPWITENKLQSGITGSTATLNVTEYNTNTWVSLTVTDVTADTKTDTQIDIGTTWAGASNTRTLSLSAKANTLSGEHTLQITGNNLPAVTTKLNVATGATFGVNLSRKSVPFNSIDEWVLSYNTTGMIDPTFELTGSARDNFTLSGADKNILTRKNAKLDVDEYPITVRASQETSPTFYKDTTIYVAVRPTDTELVNKYYWINRDGGNSVTPTAVTTSLNFSSMNLRWLWIGQNSTLTSLNCTAKTADSSSPMQELDVSKSTALTGLTCESNYLTSLNVTNNVSLTTLMCNTNSLTKLDVTHNTSLSQLSAEKNLLNTIDISHNTSLRQFNFAFNSFTYMDFTNNPSLERIEVSSSFLHTLDFTHNTALQSLFLWNDKNTGLLDTIYLPNRVLSALSIFGNPNLKNIYSKLMTGSQPIYSDQPATWQNPSPVGIHLITGSTATYSGNIYSGGNPMTINTSTDWSPPTA